MDQDTRLRLNAAAVFDQLGVRPDELHDVRDVAAQNRRLGARQVVLGELADRLEKAAALFVVEILRGNALLRKGQPREHVLAKLSGTRREGVEADQPRRQGLRSRLGLHADGRNLPRQVVAYRDKAEIARGRQARRGPVRGAAGGELQPLTYAGRVADTSVFAPGVKQHDDNGTPGKRHLHDQAAAGLG